MTGLPHHTPDLTLELLESLTLWRSVAGNLAQQRQLAAWLEQWLVQEVDAQTVYAVAGQPGSAPPLVHVRVDVGAPVTLVLYGAYDVAPAAAEGWDVDPFIGGLRHCPQQGDIFIARGALCNKGPLAGMMMTVRELYQAERLHVNLEIVLEGESERDSATLRRYLAQSPCPLPPADAVLWPAFCESREGVVQLPLGFTGQTTGQLTVSGTSSTSANPTWRLIQALNTIAPAQADGRLETLSIEGEAAEWLDELAGQMSGADTHEALSALLGSASLTPERLSARAGHNASLPEAHAELTLRTPPGSDPQALIARMRARLAAAAIDGADLQFDEGYPGVRFGAEEAGVMELLLSYQQQHARAQIWPWSTACAPAHAFAPVASALVRGGLGNGGNAGGCNEFITLKGMARFQRSLRDWLFSF